MSMTSNPAFEAIDELTDAENEFNYGSWTADTILTLTNVKWNSDYRDVVRFTSQSSLDTYINGRPNLILPNVSMNKFNTDVMIDTTINRAMQYNYLRAKNGTSPVNDSPRNYYYFITGIEYLAPNTTLLHLQLDVWQTFGYEVTFGNSYIERGHIGIANGSAFDHYGRDYLTVPEGLDVGNEYRVVHVESQNIITNDNADQPDSASSVGYDILVCSTLDLSKAPVDTSGKPQIFSSTGSMFQNVPSGAKFYLFRNGVSFNAFMAIYADSPWFTQGIISITLIPNMTRYVPGYDYGDNIFPNGDEFHIYMYEAKSDIPVPKSVSALTGWRSADFITSALGDDYDSLKKFLTYPYMIIELTTWTGSPLIIKPESWQDANATVRELAAFLPPGQRIGIAPKNYNKDSISGDPAGADDGGEYLDFATFLDNFPTLPVVNNGALLYLANNKNGIAFSYQSAEWTQQRALQSAATAVTNANSNIQNAGQQAGIQNQAQSANAQLAAENGLQNASIAAMTSFASPFTLPDAVNNVGRFAQTGNSLNTQLNQTANSVSARGASATASIQNQGRIRDSNNEFANFAAKGDYNNAVAGINAKVQDARMTQPSVSGQYGGDAFNIINNNFGYSLRWKMINLADVRRIGNYWLRYGYAVQQFSSIPSDFMCMTKFTYWKLLETYITQGPFPEFFKQTIRGIFEKGVTVWRNPDDIGNIDLSDNAPVGSYTL